MTSVDASTLESGSGPMDRTSAPYARAARVIAGVSLVLAGLLNGLSQYLTHLLHGDLMFTEYVRWAVDHAGVVRAEQAALVASMLFAPLGLLGIAQVCRWRAPRLLHEASAQALHDFRRVVQELRPPALDEFGVAEALRQLADWLGLSVRVDSVGLPQLPAAVEVASYRIAAEALSNVARHAATNEAEVSICAVGTAVRVEVVDRGSGFDVSAAAGVGLLAMRERASELGGHVALHSERGVGTSVTATLPLDEPVSMAASAVTDRDRP